MGAAAASRPGAARTLTRLAAKYQERADICIYRDCARCLRVRRRADTAAKKPSPIMVQVAGSGMGIGGPGGVSGGDPGGVGGEDPGGDGDPGGCPGGGGPTGGCPGGVDPGGVGVDGPPGPGKSMGKNGVKKGGLKTPGPVSTVGSGVGAGAKAPAGMSRTTGGASRSGLAAAGRSRTVESTRSCGPVLVFVRCRVPERLPGERWPNNARGSFSAAMIFFPTAWPRAGTPGSVTATKVRPNSSGASQSMRF